MNSTPRRSYTCSARARTSGTWFSRSRSWRLRPDLVVLRSAAPPTALRVPAADGPDLPQRGRPLRPDPASRELRVPPLHLRSHEEAAQLLCRAPTRPRPAERVEDQLAFRGGGEHGAAQEAQGLLGGVAAVSLLPHGHGG